MWNDAQALSKLSGTLLGISLLLLLIGALYYAVHLPRFALRVVQLDTVPQHEDAKQIEAVVRNELSGNFFTMDMDRTRAALEKLPWVRKASLRRHFPWQLDVALEEHVPLAHWNGDRLVDSYGEVFAAKTDQVLPSFSGPDDEASAEVKQKFDSFGGMLAAIQQQIESISLSPRRAWQLQLKSGMVLKLGREQMEQRLQRFIAVYPNSLNSVGQAASYVDLRYRNGFAVNWPGGKT